MSCFRTARGIIGGTLAGLGRALGETIAVLLSISPAVELKLRFLTVATMTVQRSVADQFRRVVETQARALLAAGFRSLSVSPLVSTPSPLVRQPQPHGATTEI